MFRTCWQSCSCEKATEHISVLCAEDGPTNALEGASADDQGTMQSMRVIYEQLANCFSSEQADEIAINFCFVQTKSMPLSRLVHQ